jgi:very-short-patch-repair endonuclease
VRQNELVEQGWTVLRFTPAQSADDPSYVTDTIARTLDRLRAE